MEPSGHCPYLGLKQNRAIRFASPTPEHRCYVSGEPIEIPVDQASFCLSQGHVHCPLYTGSMLPTIDQPVMLPEQRQEAVEVGGLRGWLATLSPRDRAIYTAMVGLLGMIVAIYLFVGLRPLIGQGSFTPTAAPSAPVAGVATDAAVGAATAFPSPHPTVDRATPTLLPTKQPATAEPTVEPTISVIFPPTALATQEPTTAATSVSPTSAPPTAAATSAPTSAPTTAPTTAPTVAPTTAPTVAPTTAPTVAPTSAPVVSVTQETVTLYFGDSTGSLYVPVQRQINVENNQIATAAVRELIKGSQSGLKPLLLPTTQLLEVRIENGTAIVNVDRQPTGAGDIRGLNAIALTLTQLPNIQQVQVQVNGKNIGIDGDGPIRRSTLNPLNPDNLPDNVNDSAFLPLYFVLNDGTHDVRLIRLIPKTLDTAQATIEALLEGPGSYGYAVKRVIPEGTSLRGLSIDSATRVISVDFSQEFAQTTNRESAVRNVVQSLTTLPNVRGVQILVEGAPLADLWGEAYRNGFGKPLINPE